MLIRYYGRIAMKRNTTKLQLNKTTIRILQGHELAGVGGGAPTANCTIVGPECSGSDRCAPTHHHQGCPSCVTHACH
jgi:hypothetical protein